MTVLPGAAEYGRFRVDSAVHTLSIRGKMMTYIIMCYLCCLYYLREVSMSGWGPSILTIKNIKVADTKSLFNRAGLCAPSSLAYTVQF